MIRISTSNGQSFYYVLALVCNIHCFTVCVSTISPFLLALENKTNRHKTSIVGFFPYENQMREINLHFNKKTSNEVC